MADLHIAALTAETHDDAVAVIIAGLTEHWGTYDGTSNTDLDDLFAAYGHGSTLVASRNAQVVGTGTVIPRSTTTAEIVRMSVSAVARRTGVARRLVDALLTVARGWDCNEVILETTSSWHDAVALYTDCGFKITSIGETEFGPCTFFRHDLNASAKGL